MNRPRLIATTCVLALGASPLVAGAGAKPKTSTAHLWQSKNKKVVCGYEIGGGHQVLCSAAGIPRPKGVTGGDGGFVVISKTGKPHTIVTFQDEFVAGTLKTLANGTSWSGRGVTCTTGATVTCKNASKHGFKIGNGKYKSF